jgi:hypothetical protein
MVVVAAVAGVLLTRGRSRSFLLALLALLLLDWDWHNHLTSVLWWGGGVGAWVCRLLWDVGTLVVVVVVLLFGVAFVGESFTAGSAETEEDCAAGGFLDGVTVGEGGVSDTVGIDGSLGSGVMLGGHFVEGKRGWFIR